MNAKKGQCKTSRIRTFFFFFTWDMDLSLKFCCVALSRNAPNISGKTTVTKKIPTCVNNIRGPAEFSSINKYLHNFCLKKTTDSKREPTFLAPQTAKQKEMKASQKFLL